MNKLIFKYVGAACLLWIFLSSCGVIFEQDISETTPNLIIPADSLTSSQDTVRFVWEELEGANHYRFQLSAPNFDKPDTFWLDTLMQQTEFSYALPKGNYQWRVRAENAGFESAYAIRTYWSTAQEPVWIDLTMDSLEILAPADGKVSDGKELLFWWKVLDGVEEYEIQIISPDFKAPEKIVLDTLLTEDHLVWSFEPGEYSWRIRAVNEYSKSAYQYRRFRVDTATTNN